MRAIIHALLMAALLTLAGHHLDRGEYAWVGFSLGFAAFNWKLFTHAWDERTK